MSWSAVRAREDLVTQAKLVAVLLFCLVNPFAGWAYLATNRAKWQRSQAPLADTLKRKRLAVLPLLVDDGSPRHANRWLDAMLSGLGGYDALETFAYPEIFEVHRDALALGADVGADLVLDASSSIVDDELSVFVRLLRIADSSVLWSQLFSATTEDFDSINDETVLAVLRTLAMA